MKAKVLETGEIVDVSFYCQKQSGEYVYVDNSFGTTSRTWIKEELVFFDEPIDWEQRKFELVKAALQGLVASERGRQYTITESIDIIFSLTEAVVAKLKDV